MSVNEDRNQEFDQDFTGFLQLLRQKEKKTWLALVGKLRLVTIPWLNKRIGDLPSGIVVTKGEFVLEIFADSLCKFYPLFEKGSFQKYQDIQSLMFRIAELKMKEAFAKLKRDNRIYRPNDTATFDKIVEESREEINENLDNRIALVKSKMKELADADRKLLIQYYEGEKLITISKNQGIPEASIRKRKQRALDRLKKLVRNAIALIMV